MIDGKFSLDQVHARPPAPTDATSPAYDRGSGPLVQSFPDRAG